MIDVTGSRWTWYSSLALGMIGLAAWLVLSAQKAQLSQALPPEPAPPSLPAAPGISATPTWQQEGPWVVRAYYVDRRQVDELAAWIEPWEVVDLAHPGRELGYVIVDVGQAGLDRLRQAGFRLEIDERLTDQLHRPNARLLGQTSGIPGYPCYRTVEETFATAQNIAASHPELAAWTDIGDSWQKTQDPASGYDLMVLRLTNRAVPGPKPRLLMTASMHAREYAPAELATRFAEYMVGRYGTDPDVTWLLDYHEIHILLQANPDGRKQAEGGLYWRKNTDNNYCTGTNSRGADLNRNFEYQWGCCGASSSIPCDEVYRGPTPASEPETRAIQDYMRALFPDQREDALDAPAPADASGMFVDLHSYGQLVLWPWGFTFLAAPNGISLQTLGRKLAFLNGYQPRQASGLYPTEGTTDGFAYGELGLAAYTVELGTAFFQSCSAFESEILPGGLSALIYAAKVARTPYLTPAGPDALAVTVLPVSAAPGQAVGLRAEVNDTRYSSANGSEPVQAIAGAEYYVDLPPWMATAVPDAHPMVAEDGVFDDHVEQVQALVDTTGLAPGRHILFVRGRDAFGNWGAWSAAFVYLLDPAVSPKIEGYVRQVSTLIPLEATVNAGPFHASTDPATGYYVMSVISGTYDLAVAAPAHVSSGVGGIAAYDHALIRQDFDLDPRCDVFADDVESGNPGWTAGAPWAISSESSHSASHAWTDSPGSSYSNGLDLSLTSPVLDLSGVRQVALQFWHTYDLEMNHDYAYVDYSIDGGTSWATAASYTGSDRTAWALEEIPLATLDGQPNARLRFRITSDSWGMADGWHVDDIALSGGGLVCLPPLPAAAFVSSSPDWLGQATTFTNITAGTGPITYTWDLGDGTPAVTQVHPTHTYGAAALYTVVLTATDASGATGTASHTVAVYGVPTAAFAASSPSWVGATTRVTNATLGSPPGDPGIAYQWDWGDGSPGSEATHSSHVYAEPGSYLVVLTATNPAGHAVASAEIRAHVAGVTVYPLHSDRDGNPGTAVTHTVHITNAGTATDTFSLSLAGNRWTTTVPAHTLPLAPGAATALDLVVDIPMDAELDARDVVTVTVTSSDRHTVASSILATRVIAHRLFLPWLGRGS